MDKLLQVFANVDSKIFESADVKNKLNEVFESAVNEKAEARALELFEAKENDYTKILEEMIETSKESIILDQKEKFNEAVDSKVTELVEVYGIEIKEEAESKLKEAVLEIEEKSKTYLELAVKEFVQENSSKWEDEVSVVRADALKEEFENLAEKFGISIGSLDVEDEHKKVLESLEKAIQREKTLGEQVSAMLAEKMLKEASSDMNAVQVDKLLSLMESVEFTNEVEYKSKLDRFKSVISVTGDSKIVESKQDEKSKKASWQK